MKLFGYRIEKVKDGCSREKEWERIERYNKEFSDSLRKQYEDDEDFRAWVNMVW